MAKCERVMDDGFDRSGLGGGQRNRHAFIGGRHGLLRSKATINRVCFERSLLNSALVGGGLKWTIGRLL
jgi:hypothetical protein